MEKKEKVMSWIKRTFPFMSKKEQRALANIIELYVNENT